VDQVPSIMAEKPSVSTYESAKAEGKCVIVARSTCAFCIRATQLLGDFVAEDKLVVLNVDKTPEGSKIRAKGKQDGNGHPTLPIIFFGNEYIGGCDDISALKTRGVLPQRLGGKLVMSPQDIAKRNAAKDTRPPLGLERWFPLFYFPHTVNGTAVRGRGLCVVTICLLTITFGIVEEYTRWTGWLNILLSCDYLVILVCGGVASPLAAFGNCLTFCLPEKFSAGAPKQFAAFLGLMFSGITGGFLVAELRWAGIIVSAMLCGAASLETFLDFCAGCWMFGMMIQFKILPPTMHNLHIGQKLLWKNQVQRADDFTTELKKLQPKNLQVRQHGQPMTSADNVIPYPKSEDHKRRDFNPIKHVQFSDFMMPLSILALAVCYQLAYYTPGIRCRWQNAAGLDQGRDRRCAMVEHIEIWQVIFFLSLALFAVLTGLLAMKLVMYNKKFFKELKHPIRIGGATSFPAYLVLLAFVLFDYPGDTFGHELANQEEGWNRTLALVCFWVGAVLLKLLMIVKLATSVTNRADKNLAQANMLFPVIGCVLVAMVAPIFDNYAGADGCYTEVGWFYFALSAVLTILLTGGTFMEAITYHWSDERIRPSVGLWVVAFHLPFLAYIFLTQGVQAFWSSTARHNFYSSTDQSVLQSTVPLDAIAHTLYFAGVSLFLVLAYMAFPMGFLLRLKFDFSFWQLAFPLDILTLSTFTYLKFMHSSNMGVGYMNGLAYGFLALTTYVHASLFFNTLFWLLKRRWLRPDYKWAPMSINLLTHEAFRFAGEGLLEAAKALKGKSGDDALVEAQHLATQWQSYSVVLEWHSHQEERHMFPEIDAFNPFNTQDAHEQHVYLGQLETAMNDAAKKVLEASSGVAAQEAMNTLASTLETYVPYFEQHLDWEEQNLLVTNRRTFNTDIMISIVKKIWTEFECKTVEAFRKEAGFSESESAPLFKPFKKDDDPKELLRYPPPHVAILPIEKTQVWRVVLPWIIQHLPMPMQRARFVKAMIWAVPERAQHIGEMIYRGVEDHEWCALTTDVPEIIPRGLPGWQRRV